MNRDTFKINVARRIIGAPDGSIHTVYSGDIPQFKAGPKDMLLWLEESQAPDGEVTAQTRVICFHYNPIKLQFYYAEISLFLNQEQAVSIKRAACGFSGE